MFRIFTDIVLPPARTPAPATTPPVDPGPSSSCISAGVRADPSFLLLLGVVGVIAVLSVLLIVLQNKKAKVR